MPQFLIRDQNHLPQSLQGNAISIVVSCTSGDYNNSDGINLEAYKGTATQMSSPLLRKGEKPHFPNVNKPSLREVPRFLECKLMAWGFILLQNIST